MTWRLRPPTRGRHGVSAVPRATQPRTAARNDAAGSCGTRSSTSRSGLFLDDGYDAVSVDDIAAAAGMSERTFFRYYATKDDDPAPLPVRPDRRAGRRVRRPARRLSARWRRCARRTPATSHVEPARSGAGARARPTARHAPAVHARSVGRAAARRPPGAASSRAGRAPAAATRGRPSSWRPSPRPPRVAWNAWVARDDSRDPAAAVTAAIDALELPDAGQRRAERTQRSSPRCSAQRSPMRA